MYVGKVVPFWRKKLHRGGLLHSRILLYKKTDGRVARSGAAGRCGIWLHSTLAHNREVGTGGIIDRDVKLTDDQGGAKQNKQKQQAYECATTWSGFSACSQVGRPIACSLLVFSAEDAGRMHARCYYHKCPHAAVSRCSGAVFVCDRQKNSVFIIHIIALSPRQELVHCGWLCFTGRGGKAPSRVEHFH